MRAVPLTQGQWALVDDEDYDRLMEHRWSARWDKHTRSFCAVRSIWIGGPGRKKVGVLMHREILDAPSGVQVDHWDHDTLNNQKHNLRRATNSQNQCNGRPRPHKRGGRKGAQFHITTGKWRARIRFGGKQHHLGAFDTEEAAHTAYRDAAQKFFGDFACVNDRGQDGAIDGGQVDGK
jgi:hypothetical protein